jgi:hypothetical protein
VEQKLASLQQMKQNIAHSAKGVNYIVSKFTHKEVRRARGQQYCINSCYLEFVWLKAASVV